MFWKLWHTTEEDHSPGMSKGKAEARSLEGESLWKGDENLKPTS